VSDTAKFAGLFVLCVGVALLLAKPLGVYMAVVTEGKRNFATRMGHGFERLLYRCCGIDSNADMTWLQYAKALLLFNAIGALFVYGLQRLQSWLPLNPQHFDPPSADSSFNTAVSFVTNTNWQGYSGESAMSHLTQMAALTVQNFVSAATGIAVAVVMVRGFARHDAKGIGNFWTDIVRSSLYVLLPLSVILALLLVSQGAIQNFDAFKTATLMEPLSFDKPKTDANGDALKDASGNPVTEPAVTQTQTIPMGPVASQEAIKELGTNGGGFYNANSAHPFENPTALSNVLEIVAILLIPLALTYTFGHMVGDTRQGWALVVAMLVLFGALATTAFVSEQQGNPLIGKRGVDITSTATQAGGNMEGKETRFGIAASALFVAAATGTSTGAVNSMHDSLMPMGGFVPLFLMQLGELSPGGVGTGLYTILIFAVLGVFIAGLMIGRTPEYLGKKIQSREMKLASIFILTTPILVLLGTAVSVMTEAGRAGIANPGAHGFSEILYAFTSAGNNNGSAFGGLSANTVYYNVALGLVMWLGRFWPIVAALAIAGSLAAKKRIPVSEGTMPTHGPLFITLLIGTIILIGVLNYVPALALGPVVEHFLLTAN
jgi:potassium-transporting ATPase potassium-binding subunit